MTNNIIVRTSVPDDEGPGSLLPPGDGGGDGDCSHEVFDVSVEARCDAPPVFDAAKEALDDVALPLDN